MKLNLFLFLCTFILISCVQAYSDPYESVSDWSVQRIADKGKFLVCEPKIDNEPYDCTVVEGRYVDEGVTSPEQEELNTLISKIN